MTNPRDYDPRERMPPLAHEPPPPPPPPAAPPHAIAADLRRLADTPGHQLTDAYRDGLRLLAADVSKLAEPVSGLHPIPIEPTPSQAGDQIRRLTREVREIHHKLTRRDAEPATAELEAVACGLDPEQEIRAQALRLAADVAPLSQVIGTATAGELAGVLLDVAEPLADWIGDGGRP